MARSTEEFISTFHSLHGTTPGERRKQLFQYLNETKQVLLSSRVVLNFASIQPKNYLEEDLKVEIFIYFRSIPDLIEIIKSENTKNIRKVLKNPWFFEMGFSNISGDQLVSEIFPHTSFNIRARIVNGIARHMKNERKADEFFSAISYKYGVHFAARLMPACSADVILKCVQSEEISLTSRQLLTIVKKHRDLMETIYVETWKQTHTHNAAGDLLQYIATTDVHLFLKLSKKYNAYMKVGRRTTKKIMQRDTTDVVKNSKEYLKMLCFRQVIRSLGNDFKQFYTNLFPAIDEFTYAFENHGDKKFRGYGGCLYSTLQRFPASEKMELLLTTFKKVYGKDLWESPSYASYQFLEMIAPGEREKWVNLKSSLPSADIYKLSCYYKTEKSIPMLKEAISLSSSVNTRANLVAHLVQTCKVNDDEIALTNVCSYVVTKHKNDMPAVREQFISELNRAFDLVKLKQQHWKSIYELLLVTKVNKEPDYYTYDVYKKYLHYLLLNNLPVKEILVEFMKNMMHKGRRDWNLLQEVPAFEKQCLLIFAEVYPSLFKDDQLNEAHITLLSAIVSWNNRHPKDTISLYSFPQAIELLKNLLDKDTFMYGAESLIKYCICRKPEEIERVHLINSYWKDGHRFFSMEIFDWFLKNEPLIILYNVELVAKFAMRYHNVDNVSFWRKIKNYHHVGIPQKFVQICLEIMNDPERSRNEISGAIIVLSHLTDWARFLDIIGTYVPTEKTVDVHSEASQILFQIQTAVANSLKNINPASLILETIFRFCLGDYLKIALRSLYHTFHYTAEQKLAPFINELVNRAVSVKKHAIFLVCKISSKDTIYDMLNKSVKDEKNTSIRKFLFKETSKFFVKNPDDKFWELMKANISAVNTKDMEALDTLVGMNIPKRYVVAFIQFVWDTLEKNQHNDGQVDSRKVQVVRSIKSDLILQLPEEFCLEIINKYLFKTASDDIQYPIHEFSSKYIVYCNTKEEQQRRLNQIFNLLKNYIASTWSTTNTEIIGRKNVLNFVQKLCSECMAKNIPVLDNVPQKFLDLWGEILKPHDAFDEFLHLNLTVIFMDYINTKMRVGELAARVAKLCDSVLNTYSLGVCDIFFDTFRSFFYNVRDEDVIELFLTGIMQSSKSTNCALLVIYIMKMFHSTSKNEQIYLDIYNTLKSTGDQVVQIHLVRYLQKC